MADIKRMRYFDQQLLVVEDFTDEQAYHIEMRKRHNRSLHTSGIAEGLDVIKGAASKTVKVTKGMAVNKDGQEIVLDADSDDIDLSEFVKDDKILITIAYRTVESTPVGDPPQNRRTLERAELKKRKEGLGAPIDSSEVSLARITMGQADITEPFDLSVRESAGASAFKKPTADIIARSLQLSIDGVSPTQWPKLTASEANRFRLIGALKLEGVLTVSARAVIDGSLAVTGGAGIEGNLFVKGSVNAENSDLYFTKTDHNHTGLGNAAGFAAIENSANFGALMILGRAGDPKGRVVKLWDYLEVNGPLDVRGKLQVTGGAITPVAGNSDQAGIQFPSNPGGGAGDQAFIRYFAISGETTKLLIGIENDASDTIGFWQMGAERMTVFNGNVGIGTPQPSACLSVVAPGTAELGGSARSATLLTTAGNLGTAVNNELALASIGYFSTNNVSLGIRALRVTNGSDWTSTAIGIGMDVDNTVRAGASLWLHANGNVGIGTPNPAEKLHVNGKLQVTGGAITPSLGNSEQAGIQFPPDPGGGGLDRAFIRYFATSGETTKLLIGIENDADDTLSFWQAGAERMTVFNGRVGIGTTTPNYILDVVGRMRVQQGNTPSAGIWLFQTIPNAERAFLGMANDNQVGLWGNTGANWGLLMDTTSGNVGIGTDNLQRAKLFVNGLAMKPGGGAWSDLSSDLRLKKNVEPLTGALERLLLLRGVHFEWIEPEKMGNQFGLQRGMIAQEVEPVFPEWVSTSGDGHKLLTITGFEALVVEALRELNAKIESLKAPPQVRPGKKPSRN